MSDRLPTIHPYKDKNDTESLIRMTPPSIRDQLANFPEELLAMDAKTLRKSGDCGEIEEKLRISFWLEYERAQEQNRSMMLKGIYSGVCSADYILERVIPNQLRLAYMLTPPANYQVQILDLLNTGLEKYREILSLPIHDKKGNVNVKLLDVQHKIIEGIHARVKGAVPQLNKNLNVNMDANKPAAQPPKSMAEINERLRVLEDQTSGIRDVTENTDGSSIVGQGES